MKLLNAFSLNMLPRHLGVNIYVENLSVSDAQRLLKVNAFESYVGHADTAALFSNILEMPVCSIRQNVTLTGGDQAIVGQYIGPRLPEGATTLPEGAQIKWFLVEIWE